MKIYLSDKKYTVFIEIHMYKLIKVYSIPKKIFYLKVFLQNQFPMWNIKS